MLSNFLNELASTFKVNSDINFLIKLNQLIKIALEYNLFIFGSPNNNKKIIFINYISKR